MEYCTLGKSDLKISRVGFGAMSLETVNPVNESLLLRALEQGINYFDTADMYQQGLNETLLGLAFRGNRHRVVLATKVGHRLRPDESGWDWNPTKKYILSAVEESLRRLQTDYIDLYQLHGGTLDDPIDEIIEAFEILKHAGKIRYYGISSIRPNVIREYVNRSSIVSVMMQYSLLDRRPEEEMLPFLLENQIGVLARGTIAKGLLASKSPTAFLNLSAEEVGSVIQALQAVSGTKRSLFDTSVQYVLNHPAISSAVIGIHTEKQLDDALSVGSSFPIHAEHMSLLKSVLPAIRYEEHR